MRTTTYRYLRTWVEQGRTFSTQSKSENRHSTLEERAVPRRERTRPATSTPHLTASLREIATTSWHLYRFNSGNFQVVTTSHHTCLKWIRLLPGSFGEVLPGGGAGIHCFDAARSCCAMVTTRSMSSHGAGFPVQISNCRAAWWTNISMPGITCRPRARANRSSRVSAGS